MKQILFLQQGTLRLPISVKDFETRIPKVLESIFNNMVKFWDDTLEPVVLKERDGLFIFIDKKLFYLTHATIIVSEEQEHCLVALDLGCSYVYGEQGVRTLSFTKGTNDSLGRHYLISKDVLLGYFSDNSVTEIKYSWKPKDITEKDFLINYTDGQKMSHSFLEEIRNLKECMFLFL